MNSSVFESFNAKNLTATQVARTFIPPAQQFEELCQRSHSVVIGPRGSGKTTLLKMLQLTAIAAWNHADAPRYQDKIDFIGVFIAADIVWREQIESLSQGVLPKDVREALSISTFTTHVFISLITAIQELGDASVAGNKRLSHLHFELSAEQEASLVDICGQTLKISPVLPSLLGVKLALRQRLGDLSALAQRLRVGDPAAVSDIVGENEYLFLSFYEHSLAVIEAVNGLLCCPELKWAFLFDELEIAPEIIRKRLLTLLRGSDGRILFKLSMSPYNGDFSAFYGDSGAKPGHDFLPITLWYSEKEDALPFSIELVNSILAERNIEAASPEAIFGISEFDLGRTEQRELGTAYGPASSNHRKFADLAEKDPSFSQYLVDNGIDLRRMHQITDVQRAAQVRKITSVVTVREAYLRHSGLEGVGGQRIRSRKRPQVYAGAPAIFALTEGNPRWIIGTLGPLLRAYSSDGRTVRKEAQTKAIAVASERFRALLSTAAVPTSQGAATKKSLLSLVDEIGAYFQAGVLAGPFKPEPPTSFIVDQATPASVRSALAVALNVGAIVFIPDNPGQAMIENMTGKRFRLTYLLAPHYRLPITIGKSRALSSILRDVDVSAVTPDLFEERK